MENIGRKECSAAEELVPRETGDVEPESANEYKKCVGSGSLEEAPDSDKARHPVLLTVFSYVLILGIGLVLSFWSYMLFKASSCEDMNCFQETASFVEWTTTIMDKIFSHPKDAFDYYQQEKDSD